MVLLLLCGRSNIFASEVKTIRYDDTYDISAAGYGNYIVADEEDIKTINVTSHQVLEGKATGALDSDVVRLTDDANRQILKATGTGTAEVTLTNPANIEDKVTLTINVEPAKLTYMMVAGQSNAAGFCSANTGMRPKDSIVCAEDQIYSTTASVEPVGTPGLHGTRDLTGVLFSESCTPDNAYKFVPENLTDERSLSGDSLQYRTDHMSANSTGRTGPDSGLAYEWNKLTGDKVWIINTAVGATGIDTWNPGGRCFENAAKLGELTTATYEAEIAAGHYTHGNKLLFWLQGENDKNMSAEEYTPRFLNMYSNMKSRVGFDKMGIIMVRSSDSGQHRSVLDLTMTGPRITQYYTGQGTDNPDIVVASNVNEQWVTDAGVKNYFTSAYPYGSLDYPLRNGVSSALPSTMAQVHNDIHYSQIGHNENGITAAYGMYKVLYQKSGAQSVSWVDQSGTDIGTGSVSVDIDGEVFVFPKAYPSYTRGNVRVDGDTISYDPATGIIKWKKAGTSYLVYSSGNREVSRIKVEAGGDFSSEVGKNFTGIYNYKGAYVYLKNGKLQGDTTLVKYNNEWWYVKDGRVDFEYNSLVKYNNYWWYVHNGKVDFKANTLVKYNNNWWNVKGGYVRFGETTLVKYNGLWWYTKGGYVRFNETTLCKYNGLWWYVKGGYVRFNETTLCKYNGYWFYVRGGYVRFNETTLCKYNGYWFYVRGGYVRFDTETLCKYNGYWFYVKSGYVHFGVDKQVAYNGGTYNVRNGIVVF